MQIQSRIKIWRSRCGCVSKLSCNGTKVASPVSLHFASNGVCLWTKEKEPRLTIKLLVKEVILYDGKVEIYYSYMDKKGSDDLEHQVSCVYRQGCDIDPKELEFRHNVGGYKLVLEMYF